MTLITTLIYKYTTDQAKLKSFREELKSIRKEMTNSKNDPKKLNDLQKRSMEISMDQFKHSLKPMIITMFPAIIAFSFLNKLLLPGTIILKLPFSIPKIGSNDGFGWLGVYLLTSIIFSTLLRKLLKVH